MNDEPKYNLVLTSLFKRDLKTIKKRGYNLHLLNDVVDTLTWAYLWTKNTKTTS